MRYSVRGIDLRFHVFTRAELWWALTLLTLVVADLALAYVFLPVKGIEEWPVLLVGRFVLLPVVTILIVASASSDELGAYDEVEDEDEDGGEDEDEDEDEKEKLPRWLLNSFKTVIGIYVVVVAVNGVQLLLDL